MPGRLTAAGGEEAAPDRGTVRDYLVYGLSLPERALRGAAGVLGGTLRESAAVLLPQAFRNAKTYRVFVGQMLDFMAEDMGGVRREAGEGEEVRVENYVARKTVGNFVELASLATVHLSPMLLLAVVSDVAYGSRAYLKEFAEELEREGVIEDAASVDRVDDLLDAVGDFGDRTATAFDTPPVSVDGIRETIRQTRETLERAPDAVRALPRAEIDRLWAGIQAAARREGVNPLDVSGVMTLGSLEQVGRLGRGALSSVQAAGTLLDRHVLDHYREVLADIDRDGLYPRLAETGRPYADALWQNFAAERSTVTERFIEGGGARRTWTKARDWVRQRR